MIATEAHNSQADISIADIRLRKTHAALNTCKLHARLRKHITRDHFAVLNTKGKTVAYSLNSCNLHSLTAPFGMRFFYASHYLQRKRVFSIAPVNKPCYTLFFCTAAQHSRKRVPSGTNQMLKSGNSGVNVD